MRTLGTGPLAGKALAWPAAVVMLAAWLAATPAVALDVRLEEVGTWNMFEAPAGALERGQAVDVPLKVTVGGADLEKPIKVTLATVDLWGRRVDGPVSPPSIRIEGGKVVAEEGTARLPVGLYHITVRVENGGARAEASADLGIVPPHREGLRPDSFFASNTSSIRTGKELALLRAIGMKVQRTHFSPHIRGDVPEPSTGAALPVNFDDLDRRFQESREAGLWVLPIVGYSFERANSEIAKKTGMHGPPRNFDEFVRTSELVVRRYPDVTTWEFWNEPWIFGWTWAADSAEYRRLHTQWCRMALAVNPRLRLLAGNSSMFAEDHIEPYPDCWRGLLAGTTHHPYSGAAAKTMRGGAQARSIDHGFLVTRRMDLPYYYLTEGGTSWAEGGEGMPDVEKNNNVNARKIVQYAVRGALVGAFQTNIQWGIGYGPAWTRPNTALAVLAHFIEDRPIAADIWPENELIYGAVFAHPRHVTDEVRRLPRAQDLGVRWTVPVPDDRAADATKVAVVWSHTGPSNAAPDAEATLTIADASGLKAYDCTGRPIAPAGGRLTVPLSEYPVYVTSDALSVCQLRERIARARIEGATPLSLYALSLGRPADVRQTLSVRVENQLNRPVAGTLALDVAGCDASSVVEFTIPAARLLEIPIGWPSAKPSPQNEYAATLTAKTDAGTVVRKQIVAVARFVRKTVSVDGDLADWAGATAVLVDSDRLGSDIDVTQYLLNPHLDRPTGTPDAKRVVARVFTAYDDANVYLAAEVHEDSLACPAGQPVVKGSVTLPYRTAMPDGLTHIRHAGDALMFAFGFRDRVPRWGRQMDDPYAWKGHFYDTDYHYAAHVSTEGDQLMRQWGPDTGRRIAYQTDKVPGYGPVRGATIKIRRDEAAKVTVYEMAIPRRELAMFDPAKGRCRFGFVLGNDEKLGLGGGLEWSAAAGVFDHWYASGSFGPSWVSQLPCQTFFGIEP